MRDVTEVRIDGGRFALVREMRVCDLDRVLRAVHGADVETLSPMQLIFQHRSPIMEALSDCVELPPYVALRDLSLTDARALWQAFIAVNPDFLALLKGGVRLFRVWDSFCAMRSAMDDAIAEAEGRD
jgi:hypothetical protein